LWVWDVLGHPLFVTAVGLSVTALIVPRWTRRWQNHQKALELKMGLVSDITEQTVDFIRSIDAVVSVRAQASGSKEWEDEDSSLKKQYRDAFDRLNLGYHSYEVARAVTAEKLRVYFPHTDLASKWESLSDTLLEVYRIQGTAPSEYYDHHLKQVAKGLAAPRGRTPQDVWIKLRATFLERKTGLIQELLASTIVSL
jgi:hypothetical protein